MSPDDYAQRQFLYPATVPEPGSLAIVATCVGVMTSRRGGAGMRGAHARIAADSSVTFQPETATDLRVAFSAIIPPMPRIARIVVPGVPHHAAQRGNNRQDVFFVDDDRSLYLKILREESIRHGAAVLGYCLMTNHTHLVIVPKRADSLAGALVERTGVTRRPSIACMVVSGHLWRNRFHSAAMDVDHASSTCSTSNATRSAPASAARRRATRGPARRPMWTARTGEPGVARPRARSPGDLDGTEWRDQTRPPACPRPKKPPSATEPPAGRPAARATHRSPGCETKLGRRIRPQPVGRPRGSKMKKPTKKRRK